jgi:hypothetical protein
VPTDVAEGCNGQQKKENHPHVAHGKKGVL